MDRNVEISIILNLHSEGYTATPTLRSLIRSIQYLEENRVSSELIIVLDNGDDATRDFINKDAREMIDQSDLSDDFKKYRIQTVETPYADLGLARNKGAEIANGVYVNFIDGDNIADRKWFYKAYQFMQIQDDRERTILHPQLYFSFGSEKNVWMHIPKDSINFNPYSFLKSNYWDSMCFASKRLFLDMPYGATNSLRSALGFEDWYWNCETLAAGYKHVIVPDTLYHYKKAYDTSSMAWSYTINKYVIPYTEYFNKSHFCTLIERDEYDGRYSDEEIDTIYFMKLKEVLDRDFVREAYYDIRKLEPRIVSTLDRDFILPIPASDRRFGKKYAELIKDIEEKYDYIYLTPWPKTGGAYKVLLNYINAVRKDDPERKILVVYTEPYIPEINVNNSFDHLDFGNLVKRKVTHNEKIELLTRLLIQLRPEVIHNVHSLLCFDTFKAHGLSLSHYSPLYATTFTFDNNNKSQYYSYGSEFYSDIEVYVKAFSSDNKYFNDKLSEFYGLPKNKLYVHYQPVENNPVKAKVKKNKEKFDVLWASRIDSEKRPDILYEIAKKLEGRKIQFHIYGESVLNDMGKMKKKLSSLRNVKLFGEFDGFSSLNIDDFDMFLYTSESDGMPNVVLEALDAKLPVIAPKIGGIPETIVDRKTGILIEDNDDVKGYTQAIEELMNDTKLREELSENGYDLINKRFREDPFLKELGKFNGYLV